MRLRFVTSAVTLALLAAACGSSSDSGSPGASACVAPDPPPEALRKMGDPDVFLLPDGRAVTPTGKQVTVGGFPVDARIHPTLPVAYVDNTGYGRRSIQVIDLASGAVKQDLERPEAFYGLEISPDGKQLYVSGGVTGTVEVYDVGADGTLTANTQIDVGGYPGGIAVSPDGKRVWVAQYLGKKVTEIDPASMSVSSSIDLPTRAYALLYVPARQELYVSGFGDTDIAVVDVTQNVVAGSVALGGNPLGLAASSDGKTVYATSTDGDTMVAIDTATRQITTTRSVTDPDITGENDAPLPAVSPSGITLDEKAGKLYVARAADSAVGVVDAATLKPLGKIPVGWYPAGVAVSGSTLVVTNAKGIGAGPLDKYDYGAESGKQKMTGTVSIVDLSSLDLDKSTAQADANIHRPDTVYPFDCKGAFPVPTTTGGKTPIEHVVLIVRENKTYDCELGDLGVADADGDPSKATYGETITPNLHKLAKQFANSDNFYDDSETSVQGHLWLTSSFVNDYMERTWLENYRGNSGFDDQDSVLERGQPDFGTFFTHLIKHNVDFNIYGEVVGSFGEGVAGHIDLHFPGVYFNTNFKDEDKAKYVVSQIVDNDTLAPFTYVLLPNDHTNGTGPNSLTPESMIADNDLGTGLLVEGITHSHWWSSTAIFLVEDDTQMGADHVDYHRSILLVMSPYAKHAYTSHVHTSYPSLFKSFEHILGVPPMNRYDALATPLYDAFTMKKDPTPYDSVPRTVPETKNTQNAPGSAYSELMDFRGPDRNPDLGDVLWWAHYGAPPAGSRIAKQIAAGEPPSVAPPDGDDVALDEAGWQHLYRYLAAHPGVTANIGQRPPAPPKSVGIAPDDD